MLITIVFSILFIYIAIRVCPKSFFRTVSFIASPFVKLYIFKRIADKLEDPKRYRERFGIPSEKRPTGDLIWIHAVSVGEVISCIPFIDILQKHHPNIRILLTTTTVTSRDIVNDRLGDRVIHQFIPFDVFTWIRRFVKYWKPKAVFFIESELWPNTLYYLYEKDIPIYLLNARISPKSLSRMLKLKSFFGVLPYKLFREVFVPSDEIRGYVRDLGATGISIIPNLKIIAKKLPCTLDEATIMKSVIGGRTVWLAVSTHPGEEEIVMEIHKDLKKKFPNILTVLAMRHPKRSADVTDMCRDNGLSYSLYTEEFKEGVSTSSDIYIVDTIGVFGMLFENIDTVFVGGSMVPGIGGHNILEPINFRCNVVTGQYTENFRDLYDYVKGSWQKVTDKSALLDFVLDSIENYDKKSCPIDIEKYKTVWEKMVIRLSKDIFRR